MEDCTSKKVLDTRVSVVGNSVLIVFDDFKLAQSFADVVLDILGGCDLIAKVFAGCSSSLNNVSFKGGVKQ